jgi:para-aminobenzoate synthetase / 4-amino-4-deoxychorismate lyase
MSDSPYVLLDDSLTPSGRTLLFERPQAVIVCHEPEQVEPALAEITEGLARGLHAAGFFSYELGYLMEPRLRELLPEDRRQPLLWIGLFEAPRIFDNSQTQGWIASKGGNNRFRISDLRLSVSHADYIEAFKSVQGYIAAGDIYQANLTLKYFFSFTGDPVALYASLRRKQRVAHGALIGTPDFHVLSLSPELFFRREDETIQSRPMKGTAPRGRNPQEDFWLKAWLAADEKQRAENLMIVDLLRNDIGRIAEIGSVKVTDLFSVETYRTVHQMTSGISAKARSGSGMRELLQALFPCGSITGAPKLRAMEIIRELEAQPRGVYTGSIGYIAPDGTAEFNVAIRTVMLEAGQGEMGIGSGLVADSRGDAEFEECLLKAKFLTKPEQPFELIETLRWERGKGFYLLERHLARLSASAANFDYPYDREAVLSALSREAEGLSGAVYMVRLLLGEDGDLSLTSSEIDLPGSGTVWRFAISDQRVDEADPFFYHKTTRRQFYDREMERQKALTACDEVVFLNSKGELTEGSRTNLFIERAGRLLTPAVASGLLRGTLREDLLATGVASEAILTLNDLAEAEKIYLGNSVRGLIRAEPLSRLRPIGRSRAPAQGVASS